MLKIPGRDGSRFTPDNCFMNIAILENLGLKEVEFDPGTVLIEKDSDQKNVYVLILGRVEARSGDQRLAVLDGPGAVLGEIAMLLGSKPVASVTTLEKSSFYVSNDFLSFIREHLDASVGMAQVLASRLIATNNHLVFIKEQLQSLQDSLRDYLPAFPDQK